MYLQNFTCQLVPQKGPGNKGGKIVWDCGFLQPSDICVTCSSAQVYAYRGNTYSAVLLLFSTLTYWDNVLRFCNTRMLLLVLVFIPVFNEPECNRDVWTLALPAFTQIPHIFPVSGSQEFSDANLRKSKIETQIIVATRVDTAGPRSTSTCT